MMDRSTRIYVAGHNGLVGSAFVRQLENQGYENLIVCSHNDLDLTDQKSTKDFFESARPEAVILAAAKVGGINANNSHPVEFIQTNISIQTNIIREAYRTSVRKLLFLGSSCIYPKRCPQPMKEEHLLTGPLEPTNRAYALAKISGVETCWAYNRQFGTRYISVMPTNLYGPGDNYDLDECHVMPALIRKVHEAKVEQENEYVVWGTGNVSREFLYSDDLAKASIHLLENQNDSIEYLFNSQQPPLINIGSGREITIKELALTISEVIEYPGNIRWDNTKPEGAPRKLVDSTRIFSTGWRPTIDLEQGIQLAYRDFLNRYC